MTVETQKTAVEVDDLPEDLQRVAKCARAAEDYLDAYNAELERRDRAIVEADKRGRTYRAIAAAARRGDGHATVAMVRNAIIKYS